MHSSLTFFSIAGQLFAAPTAQIHRFLRFSSSSLEAGDKLRLFDLRTWLGLEREESGKIILVEQQRQQVGLLVDTIIDLEIQPPPVLALPPLITAAGCDPAISGVTLVDDMPALVLDLEVLARRLDRQEFFVGDGGR
ncbi:MAG: hypothetical protein KatS3mg057_2331 [Herpetosiphonaceae bacterium]|nr:MAG: hypothetical protein KatS3mg057_2331 [Herpetosiphonaceae bacterium]